VPGYRQEPGVNPHSRTETFVAMELQIDNWRWAGVPFLFADWETAGDPEHGDCDSVQSARPHIVFREREVEDNRLVLNIQPDEGISVFVRSETAGDGDGNRAGGDEFQLPRGVRGWSDAQRVRHACWVIAYAGMRRCLTVAIRWKRRGRWSTRF